MERDFTSRSHHDMGGLEAGHIKPTEHDYELWEKRVDAMLVLLTSKSPKLMSVDQLRKGIESLPPDAYEKMSYYERWITALTNLLLEKQVVTVDELGRKMAEVEARWKAEAAQ